MYNCSSAYEDALICFSVSDIFFFSKWVWYHCFCCSPNYVIEPCSVSRDFPCPAWILWFAGRVPCSRAKGLILPLVWTWHAPHPRLLPSPCGYVYLGTGTQQLGRSLPLSGCLACPGLEAIVICYCSGRGKGRTGVVHTVPAIISLYLFSRALL